MTTRDCKLVEDLLPAYVEGMCSEESGIFIEEHLKKCANCKALRERLEELKNEEKKGNNGKIEKELFANVAKKINRKYKLGVLKGTLIMAAIVLIVGGSYFTTCKWRISRVANSNITADSYITMDQKLVLKVTTNDKLMGGMIDIETDVKSKVCYVTVKRTLIKDKTNNEAQETYFYSIDPTEVESVYIGIPDDKKLAWKKGDDVKIISDKELRDMYEATNDAFYKTTDQYYE